MQRAIPRTTVIISDELRRASHRSQPTSRIGERADLDHDARAAVRFTARCRGMARPMGEDNNVIRVRRGRGNTIFAT
jgi:hypothetical protein